MKKILIPALLLAAAFGSNMQAQSLEKMQWFNEPAEWKIVNDNKFEMVVPAQNGR